MKKTHSWIIWLCGALVVALVGGAALFVKGAWSQPPLVPDYWPTDGWRTTAPEEQGFSTADLMRVVKAIPEDRLAVDSLMIIRNGYLVLDAYYAPYDGSTPHDFASVTKSVMTTLIGIAVDQGKLQLDQRMVSFFPERSIANLDNDKENITILDLVTNRNGMESGCLSGDGPTLDAMRATPDWIQSALDRRMVHKPGTRFCYDSPGMHLLSAILQKATGMTALEFARQNLFAPLGFSEVVWEADPQGVTHGWGDLHMRPADAAKLGYLWLNHGNWDGRQIVSEGWVENSIKVHSWLVGNDFGYGYGWWISPVDYYAEGRGEQFMRVIPARNTVIVTTGGFFNVDRLIRWLAPLLIRADGARPANPDGVAALNEAVANLLHEPEEISSPSTPATAAQVSRRIYVCDENGINLASLSLDFSAPELAVLEMNLNQMDTSWSIGTQGKFHVMPDGQMGRGYWQEAQTFVMEIFDVGLQTRLFHFDGNQLEITLPELDMTITCQAQNP